MAEQHLIDIIKALKENGAVMEKTADIMAKNTTILKKNTIFTGLGSAFGFLALIISLVSIFFAVNLF